MIFLNPWNIGELEYWNDGLKMITNNEKSSRFGLRLRLRNPCLRRSGFAQAGVSVTGYGYV
jgi:hypothetical protein